MSDIQAQRDALAAAVAKVWANAREAYETDAPEVEDLMVAAGLAERYGDGMIRLTELGLAALTRVKL